MMADPKVPTIDPKSYLLPVVRDLEKILQSAFADGYQQGYAQGDADAITRILKAVQPASSDREDDGDDDSKLPGAETHKLVETVLRDSGEDGATPMEICVSPANRHSISRQAINKVLRRGETAGRYRNKGGGRYVLGRGAA